MVGGYFRIRVTAKNTGARSFIPGTYVTLYLTGPATSALGTWAKKQVTLGAGESSWVDLQSLEADWTSGTWTYDIRLYYKATSEPTPITVINGWNIYAPIPQGVDTTTQIAKVTGTIVI